MIIDLLKISGPVINYEFTLRGDNISQLRKNIEGDTQSSEPSTGNSDDAGESEGLNVIIRRLELDGARVTFGSGILTTSKGEIEIDPIVIEDIGVSTNGVEMSEVIRIVFQEMTETAAGDSAVSQQLLKASKSEAAGKLMEGAKGLLNRFGKGKNQ